MMRMFVYGAGEKGKELTDTLPQYINLQLHINSYIDREKKGNLNGIPITSIKNVYEKNERVVIAIKKFSVALEAYLLLKTAGFSDIWWFKGRKRVFGRDFFYEQCASCQSWQEDMIENMEMHVMDACNLNCKGCSHFSPIFERITPDIESRMQDISTFIKKGVYPARFNLLGGEPFLNLDLGEYASRVRKLLPNTEIVIVTNGLLIPRTEDCVLRMIAENQIKVSISEYEPTHRIIDEICEKLDRFRIVYEIRSFDTKEKFNKPLSTKEATEEERLCISNGCITLWNGKIARCPTLMYIDKLNERFGTDFPNDGIMSLQSCPKGSILLNELKKDVPLCKHCVKNEIDWHVCGKEVDYADFGV